MGIEQHHIAFAHRLRGVAALIVMLHHYLSFLYAPPQAVFNAIGMVSTIQGENIGLVALLMRLQLLLEPYALDVRSWGPFGVSVFFLVSGFVIPSALLRVRAHGFLIGRFFRLWPTYAVGLVSVLLVLTLAAFIGDSLPAFSLMPILTNLLLVEDVVYGHTIDLVSWTLTIEVMFYLFCVAVVPVLRLADTRLLVMFAVLLGMLGYTLSQLVQLTEKPYLSVLARDLRFMPYLFIGTLFHFHYRGLLSHWLLIFNTLLLLFLHIISRYLINPTGAAQQGYYMVFAYAYVAFALCYLFYNRVNFLPKAIGHAFDKVATISYPLYLVHAVHGYVVINTLLLWGAPVWIALLGAGLWSFLLAYGLHRWVEKPTHAFARRLAQRYPVPDNRVRRKILT